MAAASQRPLSHDEVRDLPAVASLPTAALSLSRTTAYALVRLAPSPSWLSRVASKLFAARGSEFDAR